MAAANLDGGGSIDLAVVNSASNTLTILSNDGSGAFTPGATLATGASPSDVRAGLLLGASAPDLVVMNFGEDTAMIFANDGAGQFGPSPQLIPTGLGPLMAQIGDLDNDKWPDVVIIDEAGGTATIARNTGVGGFLPSVQLPLGDAPRSLALVDLNDDGNADIAAVVTDEHDQRVVRILRNDFDGEQLTFALFGDEGAGSSPLLVASGDLTGSGSDDLIVIGESSLAVRGEESGVATALLGLVATPCPGDADGDGVVDFTDFSIVLAQYGQSGPGLQGDLNGDGVVDFTDFSVVLAHYGTNCE